MNPATPSTSPPARLRPGAAPQAPHAPARLLDGAVDLLLGSECVVCRAPGPAACADCLVSLPVGAARRTPVPCPPGLVPAYSAADYDGPVRELVLAHKERGIRSLGRPLGLRLALAVAVALADDGADIQVDQGPAPPVVLVPVPSRAAATRARGEDPTARLCRLAAARIRQAGGRARCLPLLRMRPGVADQAGLDRAERAANLAGSMLVRQRLVSALARAGPAHVVVCDDVLTTGSSAREAQRCLEAAGLRPRAVATVAATVRRTTAGAGADAETRSSP